MSRLPPVYEEDVGDPSAHMGIGTAGLGEDLKNRRPTTDDDETVQDGPAGEHRR